MTTHDTSREQGTSSHIRRIVADFLAGRSRGESLSEIDLIALHPELMPELADELARAQSASEQPQTTSPNQAADAEVKSASEASGTGDSSVTATFDNVATHAHKHSATVRSAVPTPRIGHYEILELLGEGGFGTVYLAKDVDLERPVAIKVAKPNQGAAGSGATFLDEARRVALLNHPSIVKILDISRGDVDAWYLVMEYVDGPSLFELYREGNLSITGLVRLMVQVADGVHHAHTHGILHRDLKPGNVLLGKDGRPRIVDFGMALQAREQPFAPRQASGTPYCMAPEQVRGETHRLDARTDLWSLGVLLYEGLTGKRPFTDKSVEHVFESILGKEPAPPSQLNQSIPLEIERICLKCMSKRMADRYTTVAELSAELQRWLQESEQRTSKESRSVSGQLATTEADEAVRVVPRGLRSFGSEDAGFFLDLLPGPRNRNGLPDSVQFWIRGVENLERRADLSVLVLYGPSGTGKSSFVRAGVLPRCANSLSTVVVDAAGNLERELLISLHRVRPDLPVQIDLARACAIIRQGAPAGGAEKVLIVLDQFEQWLYANDAEDSEGLIRALRQCDGVHLQCLLIVRSDFWVGITRFMRQLELSLVEGLNSAHLDLFDARHARKVLTLFGRSYGNLPPLPDALSSEQQQFVDDAVGQVMRDGWVMPVRLALLAEMLKAQDWKPETLQELGGERGIGVAYLDQVFASPLAAPAHRRYRLAAEGLLRALLPDAGVELKGRGLTQRELRQASGLADKPERFNELIDILDSQLRLITPTEGATSRTASGDGFESSACVSTTLPTFQLTHDYLVPALREWLTREQQSTARGRAELLLEERERLWRQDGQTRFLPSLPETLRIVALSRWNAWTAMQRAMLKKAAGFHLRRSLLVLAAIVGVAALLYSWLPPAPLPIYLNPSEPAVARNDAFDRLDLSSVAALGPALAAMKREQDPQVLKHTIAGLEQFVSSLPPSQDGLGDSVRDLILTVSGELLHRAPGDEGLGDEELQSRLFATYAALATPESTLEFIVDQFHQGTKTPEKSLADYLHRLADARLLEVASGDKISPNLRRIIVNLIELIDVLPDGQTRNSAAQLLDNLSAAQRIDLFLQSFATESYSLSSRSVAIYIASKPEQARADQATRHLAEIAERIDRYQQHQDDLTSDELVFLLANATTLQQYAHGHNENLLGGLTAILERRNEFSEDGVIDEACAAFGAAYLNSPRRAETSKSSLDPLIETLRDTTVDAEARASAAKALGAIGSVAGVDDLETLALDGGLPNQLRLAAIGGLGEIARQQLKRGDGADGVTPIFVKLIARETSDSSSGLLGEVIKEYATFARMSEFPRFVELLTIEDENIYAERATYVFLIRFPEHAAEIVDQTLAQTAQLTDEQAKSLLPSPDKMFGEFSQIRAFYSDAEILESCRALSTALANTTALDPNPAVRKLAGQNLSQLLISTELPQIDTYAEEANRKRQLAEWQREWLSVSNRLTINASGQLEVRSEESPELLSK